MDHFEIGEIEVFVDISVSPFNFACMSSKNIANLAASNATLTRCAITVYLIKVKCNFLWNSKIKIVEQTIMTDMSIKLSWKTRKKKYLFENDGDTQDC